MLSMKHVNENTSVNKRTQLLYQSSIGMLTVEIAYIKLKISISLSKLKEQTIEN